ncbi:hypothetical protein JQ91_002472 [Salmonella enterica subsp. enterica]|nr:hypothetical protein [Salmonella enterica subsp. enterica]EDR2559399.1 hypothetical protein [Salmonella enterica subsp. enterica]EDR2617581.1 hypothetical protein [Salmonella enterica subsp. enterica]
MPVVVSYRCDWFRIIEDISRTGIPLAKVASEIEVSKSALLGWKSGAEPAHRAGERLIEFWCFAMERRREDLPVLVYSRRFMRTPMMVHSNGTASV